LTISPNSQPSNSPCFIILIQVNLLAFFVCSFRFLISFIANNLWKLKHYQCTKLIIFIWKWLSIINYISHRETFYHVYIRNDDEEKRKTIDFLDFFVCWLMWLHRIWLSCYCSAGISSVCACLHAYWKRIRDKQTDRTWLLLLISFPFIPSGKKLRPKKYKKKKSIRNFLFLRNDDNLIEFLIF